MYNKLQFFPSFFISLISNWFMSLNSIFLSSLPPESFGIHSPCTPPSDHYYTKHSVMVNCTHQLGWATGPRYFILFLWRIMHDTQCIFFSKSISSLEFKMLCVCVSVCVCTCIILYHEDYYNIALYK